MSLVILSDLHLGDPVCSLVAGDQKARRTTDDYQRLIAAIREHDAARGGGGIDYLVMLGDVIDCSVASQGEAYDAASVFFRALAAERAVGGGYLVKQIIYEPGNHDFPIWMTVMHQANVVNRLEEKKPVIDRWSSPGIIDYRAGAGHDRGRLNLPKVTKQPGGDYGGLYLDALTRIDGRRTAAEPRLIVNVAYPNLYIVDDQRTTLLTHGHYLESAWAVWGELFKEIAGEDLRLAGGTVPSIDDIVSLNLPFAELTSASLGMSGPLVPLARIIQREYKDKHREPEAKKRLPVIRKYLGRVKTMTDNKMLVYGGLGVKEKASDWALDRLEGYLVKQLRESKAARNNESFPEPRWVQAYHQATDLERDMLAREHGLAVPEVTNMICAHSHDYIACGGPGQKQVELPWHDRPVAIANTGGWLRAHDKMQGGIFFCDFDGERVSWSSTVLE